MAFPRSALRFLLISSLALALAHLVDWWAAAHVVLPRFQNTDLGRLLRIQGFLPTWIVVGAALVLVDWPLRSTGGTWAAYRRGVLVAGSAALRSVFTTVPLNGSIQMCPVSARSRPRVVLIRVGRATSR